MISSLNRKGFTLVEMVCAIVVIAIIGVAIAFCVAFMFRMGSRAKEVTTITSRNNTSANTNPSIASPAGIPTFPPITINVRHAEGEEPTATFTPGHTFRLSEEVNNVTADGNRMRRVWFR